MSDAPRAPTKLARAARVGLACGLAMALLAGMALGTGMPWMFPSLGPTAFIAFATPGAGTNRLRRVLVGHALGLLGGYAALAVCGLLSAPPVTVAGVDGPRVGAAALALGITGGGMVLLDAEHPPAGATTLIVALGLLTRPDQLAVMLVAVFVLAIAAAGLTRLLRLR